MNATNLLCLLGDQLWWDLDALAQWGGTIEQVVLAGTDDELASGRAADRMTEFIAENFPAIKVRVERLVPNAAVTAGLITALLDADNDAWIVSCAGGQRLTYLGAFLAVSSHERATLVYRDRVLGWHILSGDGSMQPIDGIDPRATDRLSAASLLSTTWGTDEFDVRFKQLRVAPPIDAAAQRTVNGEDWLTQFDLACREARRAGSSEQEGFLFEQFIRQVVRHLGVDADDLEVGSKLVDNVGHAQEVDVIVNANGRLHLIDCKLTVPSRSMRGTRIPCAPMATQVREAEATRHHLGDGADQVILLRPNWETPETIRDLAHEYGVQIVDRFTLRLRPLPTILRDLLGLA